LFPESPGESIHGADVGPEVANTGRCQIQDVHDHGRPDDGEEKNRYADRLLLQSELIAERSHAQQHDAHEQPEDLPRQAYSESEALRRAGVERFVHRSHQ
jgi:hypothetical protein